MFKLVVLSALLALACAKPSLLHSALVAPAVYSVPSAVSHQSRVDVHSSPVVAYSGPVWGHSAWAAPWALGHHAPATLLTPHGVPLDTADVVAAKAIHYRAHALANHGLHHHYLHKRSAVYPWAYSAVVAPSAVSHQSRVDIHSSPVLSYGHVAPLHYNHVAPLHYSSPLALWAPHSALSHHW